MKSKLFKIFTISICVHMILFNNVNANKHIETCTIVPAEQTSIKTIIFDLGDVLIASSRTHHLTALCMVALRYPSLLYTFATKDIKQELFTSLHTIPSKTNSTQHIMYNNGKPMPQIMVDWLTGRSNTEVLATTLAYLSQENNAPAQKAMLCKIIQRIFEPTLFIESLYPIKPMVKLTQSLKRQGYNLYILSNWDKESFPLLIQKYPSLFEIFDGIMISGAEGIGKPDPAFYTKLLEKYNLNPTECIFIDDEEYNIKAAQNLGIHGVLHNSTNSVYLQLKELGILQPINP